MGKCLFVFICFMSTYTLNVNSGKTVVRDMIKDFLVLQKPYPRITLFLCWERGEVIKLSETLQKANYFVTIMNLPYKLIPVVKPVTKQIFVLDANCKVYNDILDEGNTLKLFQPPYEWILLTNTTIQMPHYLEIFLDSKFYIIIEKMQSTFHIEAIYKFPFEEKYITNDIGVWKSKEGFEYYKFLSTVRNRTNLMGRPLNLSLVIFEQDTLNHLTDYKNKHVDIVVKVCYAYVSKVVQTMNASEEFLIHNDHGYYNDSTRKYSEMLGSFQLGQTELAGSVMYITSQRISIVDFVAPTPYIRSVFILRKPPLSYVANIYTLPFDKTVWLASFCFIGIVPLIVYIIVKWEWLNPEPYGFVGEARNALRRKFSDVVLMEVGAICQQGAEAEPKSCAGRVATIIIFVAFLFLYTSYSANIVALMQSTSDTIQTIEDLLTSQIKLGSEDLPYARVLLRAQTEPTRKEIYKQKIAPKDQPPNYFDILTGVSKMRNEFFAFLAVTIHVYNVISDTFQEHEKCSLKEIDFWGYRPPHLAIKKNSTYKELIKVGYRKVHEHGIQSCEINRFCTKKPVCQAEGGNFKNVDLLDCYFVIVIFVTGVGMSLVVFLIEYTFSKIFGHH